MIDVQVVASGFGLKKSVVEGSIKLWDRRGVSLNLVKGVVRRSDLLCSSDLTSRVLELKKAFMAKSDGDVVWALRGGYGAQEILPHLKKSDFKSKKTYIGFSDGTSIHYYLNKNLGISSVHGPHANAVFQKFTEGNINSKISALLEDLHSYSDVFKGLKLLNKPKVKSLNANVIGGNLTTLVSILGTKFDKGTSGDILFLEEVDEPAYKVNRLLVHMDQAGFLNGVKAVVFGHFTHSSKAQQVLIGKVLKRWALSKKFPVVSGLQAGHDHKNNNPLWLGKKSKLILDGKPQLLNNI